MQLVPILVRPMYAGNVGAAVRVAANLGVTRMVLVDPECSLEEGEFPRMAMGAQDRVEIAVVPDLAAALMDADVAVATTSGRSRDPRGLLSPAEVGRRARAGGAASLAVVFGPERKGLTRDELHRCQMLCTIPANPEFPVFNLAQAVGVMLAALAGDGPATSEPADREELPAPAADFEATMAQLERVLSASGFLDPVNPARVMLQVRRLVGRAIPSRREIAILRALAAHIDYLRARR